MTKRNFLLSVIPLLLLFAACNRTPATDSTPSPIPPETTPVESLPVTLSSEANTDEPNTYSEITDISLNKYYPPFHNIDKGMHIRAVVKSADGSYGPVVTNSYFIGKTASYYKNLRVISMVTDKNLLFHKDTGAYMVGSR